MKINFCPAVQRHLRAVPDASIEDIQMKAEASYFARCLLMPESMIRDFWGKINTSSFLFFRPIKNKLGAINDMAKIFAVPRNEMVYRLKELNLI